MTRRLSRMLLLCRSAVLPIVIVCLGLFGSGTNAAAAENPCSLLTAAEVEAVLGAPLAGPPYRANGSEPSATGGVCRYELANFRAIDVEVDWQGGGQVFQMTKMTTGLAETAGLKGILTLSDGTELKGAWDEALTFMCCQFNALHGDQRVLIDISASRLSLKEAGALANLAVPRLDTPLDVVDDEGVTQALERAHARPGISSACTLVTRAEAEALVGAPLLADPEGGENGCTYVWTPPGTDYQMQINLSVTWRGGFGEYRQILSAIGAEMDLLAEQGLEVAADSSSSHPGFDEYTKSIIGVMGVRKDVLLSIESGPESEMAEKFISLAARKL